MCLIAYVPTGEMLREDVMQSARNQNSDGIGVMSSAGVVRFIGKKSARKLRRYLQENVAGRGIPYAVHWRFATHGAVSLENTHPFRTPNGAGHVMHNGVIHFCATDRTRSDTAQFTELLDDYPGCHDDGYMQSIENVVGGSNLVCILNADGSFSLANEDCGEWIGGVWYSNESSLPVSMQRDDSRHWYRTGSYAKDTGETYDAMDWERDARVVAKLDAAMLASTYDPYTLDDDDAHATGIASDTRAWRRKHDDDYRYGDFRISSQGGDDYATLMLPAPEGYRIRSTDDYYASFEPEEVGVGVG